MDDLPAELLRHVLQCLDHQTLHAAELTSRAWRTVTRDAQLWRALTGPRVRSSPARRSKDAWKQLACLTQRRTEDTQQQQLLVGVQSFSSADRSSESPVNTLTPSRCWMELHRRQEPVAGRATDELRTVGERIQHRCGCSAGRSCYWSSSASVDPNASEFIDYAMADPCVVTAVQIVPYRVFWHPDSPTYAPQRVRFAFFDVSDHSTTRQHEARGAVTTTTRRDADIEPFYTSHDYNVQNDMTLQDFVLPQKVVASANTVLRITLVGRHQAQTFELPPQDVADDHEDRRPKYYCCISHVNVRGVLWKPIARPTESDAAGASHMYKMSPNLRVAALTGLAMYITACYEGYIGRTRRWE
ncbi:unnamed protein product [Hyaloperonospora brassicae]|uniref:F-box domain-containing protein n=1 Tax=Hyaloperonospora brassicae TaxID=162125 RepID=A0AAV0UEM0_HYABA|nr:unnamed protein product [Hyaloperonospora brassicae]